MSRKPLAMPESVHPLPNPEQIGLQAQIKKTKPRLHPSSAASSSIPPTGAAGERPGTAPGSQFSRGAKEDSDMEVCRYRVYNTRRNRCG